jgi:6-phosphogluconolactonase (cycloisomerase 2 family)
MIKYSQLTWQCSKTTQDSYERGLAESAPSHKPGGEVEEEQQIQRQKSSSTTYTQLIPHQHQHLIRPSARMVKGYDSKDQVLVII